MVARICGALAAVAAVVISAGRAAPSRADSWTASMNGAAETPANDSKGSGKATFTLKGSELSYTLTANGMSGPATAAHIHIGAPGVAGPPVYTFKIDAPSGTVAKGVIDLSKPVLPGISGDSLKTLLQNGNAYVNVHTDAHPKGEIRGQVVRK